MERGRKKLSLGGTNWPPRPSAPPWWSSSLAGVGGISRTIPVPWTVGEGFGAIQVCGVPDWGERGGQRKWPCRGKVKELG